MGLRRMRWLIPAAACWGAAVAVGAQETGPPRNQHRPIAAIAYTVGRTTPVILDGTGLVPRIHGQARVLVSPLRTTVAVDIRGFRPATLLGPELLTYVLWAVAADGAAMNLGKIMVDPAGRGRLKAETSFQKFALLVTAEPYSAVRRPSEVVVLENAPGTDTRGAVSEIRWQPVQRDTYRKAGGPHAVSIDARKTPIEVYEARNAVDIAVAHGAEHYAPGIFLRAERALRTAEAELFSNGDRRDILSHSRQAAEFAEDARALAVERQAAEVQARRVGDEEAQRQAELAPARQTAVRTEAARETEIKDVTRETAWAQAAELRSRLLDRFNSILNTRDTVRGLVVTLGDFLFGDGGATLLPESREKLARLCGIVLAHPTLRVEVDGASAARTQTVREFLTRHGLAAAIGTGRPKLVELVVTGESIGAPR